MKKKLVITVFVLLTLAATQWLDACSKASFAPATPLNFTVPAGFPQPTYAFQNNPLSQEGFLLGRKLFYEGRLSKNGAHSCASCHMPAAAFTTFDHDRSHGYGNTHTLRNAPGLFNLAWYPAFRHDGSAPTIEAVTLAHIQAPDEMAESVPSIINKLKDDTSYQRLFRQAWGSAEMNQDRLLKSIAQFVVSLVSADAKFDRVQKGQQSFTPAEQSGYTVFQNKCSSCHAGALFTDFSYRNTGLPADPFLNDAGRMRMSGSSADAFKFRVPSLRNVDFTAYYGHDGRFSFFRHMIGHYRNGVQQHPTLDPLLSNGISLSQSDEDNLVAFLRTLSDSAFLNNPRARE